MPEMSGYSFPNDIHVTWSLMIVMYPYITGFVAGAFIVTSLYHVFGRQEFKPVARLAMATSFCFLAIATMPLLNHLGHPERGVFVVITPNFASAMAGFGLLYSFYLIVLTLEVWFVYRKEIIETARRSRGLKRFVYAALALGTYDTSPEALAIDHKAVRLLCAIGLPSACMLHGYVGFIFGAIKANPWWSTPLMPVIFLLSAAVSGIGLLIVLYQAICKFRRAPIEAPTVTAMARWLWFFLILTATLETLEVIMLAYEKSESWQVVGKLLGGPLSFSFWSLQMILGSLIPFILLFIVVVMNRFLHDRIRNTLTMIASLLLLVQVFSMRWNIVIGGQLLSKSFRGWRGGYTPALFDREGVLVALGMFVVPFVLLFIFNRVLPIYSATAAEEEHDQEPSGPASSEAAPAGGIK